MIFKKMLIPGVIVILLLLAGLYTGFIPLQFTVDTTTENKEYFGVSGYGELLKPDARKGYITSYMTNGLSETITVQGNIDIDTWANMQASGYHYEIYGKKSEWADWEPLSRPGETKRFVSAQNPGVISFPSGFIWSGVQPMETYSFEIVGSTYKAIRADLIINCKNSLIPWESYVPRRFQRDEASLYEGFGGLYLPKDADGRPRSTFEIGETVRIDVETNYGGRSVGETQHHWMVVLRKPTDQGGQVIKEQTYGDNVKSQFVFEVTEDMFKTTSNNRYEIEIYNTILPQGTLNVNTIDILAKAPSNVEFINVPLTSKVGNTVTVNLKAQINSQTQLQISYFEVSVIYGDSTVLLPSNPTSNRWLVHTTDITAENGQATISFTPTMQSYVTIHAKAYDTEGRASPNTRYYTLYAYEGSPPPEDTIPDVGEGDYGGGQFDGWWPWDPSGTWEGLFDDTIVYALIAVIIALVFVFIALFLPIPPQVKILVAVLGVVLSVIIFYFLNKGF